MIIYLSEIIIQIHAGIAKMETHSQKLEMAECIMDRRVYGALSRKDWKIKGIQKHYHYGYGPLFAFSMVIKPLTCFLGRYWIWICNDLIGAGLVQSLPFRAVKYI